jgi:hypothetical protein
LPQARSNARRRAIGLALPPPKLKPRKCSSDTVAVGVCPKKSGYAAAGFLSVE